MSSSFFNSTERLFHYYKDMAEKAMEQVSDQQLFHREKEEDNSIAIIVGHLSGNMLSRFTDFLKSDGEKEWRQRDREFEPMYSTRTELQEGWEKGWSCVFQALEDARSVGEDYIVYIRTEGHTVQEALQRQLAHYAYHIGQIVLLAKSYKGAAWKSLSIPKGGSDAFNAEKFSKDKSQKHFTEK
ncbi:MAG: DUF1572 family protein [Saprospiraceae bacterium]|nr:DUF1572 family protein [Saprospiraceae bacterium]